VSTVWIVDAPSAKGVEMLALVVADDPDIAYLFAMMPRSAGQEVVVVGTLSDARSRLGSLPAPDVVILAWSKEDRDVLDFRREAETAWPDLPILDSRSMSRSRGGDR
jgi:CheY-like chemotaxis protein